MKMKRLWCLLLPSLFAGNFLRADEITPFDSNWLFLQADATNAEQNNFADSSWRKLDVPHDWSIAGPFSETNATGGSGGFVPAGTGWYRKHFTLPKNSAAEIFSIEFDGVMHNSDVWINGFHLGHRPNGYVGLNYELTGHLNFDGDNVIAVRCDNSVQPASRFYAGAGIYRHVRLVENDAIHFDDNGIFVLTPKVSESETVVTVETTWTNEANSILKGVIQTALLAPDGKIVETQTSTERTFLGETTAWCSQQFYFSHAQLWNLDSPNLYHAVSKIISDGKILDVQTNVFGIRDAHFEADTGFWLNGKNFKVKGVCLHEDGGAFGGAVPISIWEARLKTLKTLGVNAIRTAHNPPAPEFLDLCDRQGFLVMDELFDCWTVGKQGLDGVKLEDYHLYFDEWSKTDLADTVRRDRNHPSIILYSAGNEIHDTPQPEKAKKILVGLVEVFHANDPTRPVTQALFRPNVSGDYTNGLADLLDVVGQNYREKEILAAHVQKPSRKIIGTENTHDRNQWLAVRDNAPYAGQFLWTGVDYLGESRAWPTVGSGAGLLDRTGKIKPVGYERQSWWLAATKPTGEGGSDAPMVKIVRRVSRGENSTHTQRPPQLLSDWTPENLAAHEENVEIYSNAKEVELLLNEKSMGVKKLNIDAAPRNWSVPFAPGILKAVARDENGKNVATDELKTAGAAAKIILSTEAKKLSSGFDNVAIVRATIVDKNGIEVPRANNLISFQLSGPGQIAAVDSADNASHESFQAAARRAFQGECVAFVRADAAGKITLTASAPGLKADRLQIKTESPK